jgi:hypothetical protein
VAVLAGNLSDRTRRGGRGRHASTLSFAGTGIWGDGIGAGCGAGGSSAAAGGSAAAAGSRGPASAASCGSGAGCFTTATAGGAAGTVIVVGPFGSWRAVAYGAGWGGVTTSGCRLINRGLSSYGRDGPDWQPAIRPAATAAVRAICRRMVSTP